MRLARFAILVATVTCTQLETQRLLTDSRREIHDLLHNECLLLHNRCSHDELENTTAKIRNVIFNIGENVNALGVAPGVIHDCIHRFLLHNDSRVESAAVPIDLRGSPELDLAWGLLNSIEYNALRCTGSMSSTNHLCHQRVEDLSWNKLMEIASSKCGNGGKNKRGKEYHSRLINEMSLRRADLSRWFLAVVEGTQKKPDAKFLGVIERNV
jgi:hypothetical protein